MKTYLEERIEWYDDNYRNGNALISDKQFDQLEKNLLRTNPNCDYFKKKNKLVLPSLEKDSIDEFLKGLLETWRKQFQEKGQTLLVNLLKSKTSPIISLYEEFFKLEVNYTHPTKVQISPRESLLDF